MSGARLVDAVSPYLRSHAANPVDWYPWGPAAFAAAAERDVPVLVSVGYATCHWCHVMARESFSDPALAAVLNDGFVAIKVDREEHPEVDATCLAAAGAFTPSLGWPLNVFMTPAGRVFHAGTYSPPRPAPGHPSFRQVLAAVREAWTDRRDELERSAAGLAQALADSSATAAGAIDAVDLQHVVAELGAFEDPAHGGFGGAPKFPTTPLLLTLLALGHSDLLPEEDRERASGIAVRALTAIRDGGLRDAVEGGFFRYATRRDWTEPHYERMLTDNALLLRAYARIGDAVTAAGIVGFLQRTLERPEGGFASGQDSESDVDGQRSEGGYYRLDAAARRASTAPEVDRKVLTGWNGLAIGALADAGVRLDEPSWVALAVRTADAVLARHLRGGRLLRASRDGRVSDAVATLEDRGALAEGLLEAALAAGRPDLAVAARALVDAALSDDGRLAEPARDPTLAALGVPAAGDESEGAAPSGATSIARAARLLHLLTGDTGYAEAAAATLAPLARGAVERPIGAGGVLGALAEALEPVRQVVVLAADPRDPLVSAARALPASVTAVVDDATAAGFAAAGFELFAGRTTIDGRATAYVCRDFVCRLPITDPAELSAP